jgi:hypothetical protein
MAAFILTSLKRKRLAAAPPLPAMWTKESHGKPRISRCRLHVVCLALFGAFFSTFSWEKSHSLLLVTNDGNTFNTEALIPFARSYYANDSKVIFPSASTDAELQDFINSRKGGSTVSLDMPRENWMRRLLWGPQDLGGYNRAKPTCSSSPKSKRKAIFFLITSADDFYFYQLQLSVCTVRDYNPTIEIVVGLAPEYFGNEAIMQSAMDFLLEELNVTVLVLEKFECGYQGPHPRFNKNWLRLRLWELEGYFDMILYLDADVIVRKDISHLLELDIHFAAVSDMDKDRNQFSSFGTIQGGVLLIQPCKQVFLQMRAILEHNDISAFIYNFAEQSFLDWYFKFDGFRLGYQYNTISSVVGGQSRDNQDASAQPEPHIVHFTREDKIDRDSDLSRGMQWMAKSCHERKRAVIPDFLRAN